jgi:DNA-binding NarL/FixJ family response regulator
LNEIITVIDAIIAGKSYINLKYHTETEKTSWQKLTARENEIAALVKQSLSNKQIAKKLSSIKRGYHNTGNCS